MKIYISILRGVNVGGKNRIHMDALRLLYEDLGFSKVRTYIQSGNVVFCSKATAEKELEREVTLEILNRFGCNVPVIVKEWSEIKSILEQNPFLRSRSDELDKLHFTFLSRQPDPGLLNKITSLSFDPDEYNINGNTIYLYCPIG